MHIVESMDALQNPVINMFTPLLQEIIKERILY